MKPISEVCQHRRPLRPGRIACFFVVALGVAGAAVAAEEAMLADAAEDGNGALIRKLLDGGAEVNAAQVDGMTALHWATYRDDAETCGTVGSRGRRRQRAEQLWRAAAIDRCGER